MAASFVTNKFIRSLALGLVIALFAGGQAFAQFGGDGQFFRDVVGGVSISPDGVLLDKPTALSADAYKTLLSSLNSADTDINKSTKLRMISLKGLDQLIAKHAAERKPLPPEVQYMAGMQRIEYVIASPENNDVILAGPGEGWTVNESGSVVGKTTGMPVIRLEDFLVAMRSVQNARQGQGISVSIDPTAEGVQRLRDLYANMGQFNPEYKSNVEQAMGNQTIRLTGIPADSRFSQILVAADYKMKRLSMGLEASPIANLPSFPEIAQQKNLKFKKAYSPRFWMECNYQPVAKSADSNVWQVRGQGVRTLTEEGFFDKDGKAVDNKGKTNKHAKRWADSMTERFEELAQAEPVFRELRNMMDLSVVSAIIARERLLEKASCVVSSIDGKSPVSLPSWNVPKTVPTQCSFVKLTNSWLVFASGGVQVDSWAVASNSEEVAELASVGEVALAKTADRWWWNSTDK